MRVDIFIGCCAKHFHYLPYCLRSIDRFTSGFNQTVLHLPSQDVPMAAQLIAKLRLTRNPTLVHEADWPRQGMLFHMHSILNADRWCPQADFVLHTDVDCVFTKRVTPADYILGGKPFLRFERFDSLMKRHPQNGRWQAVTRFCLPCPVDYETMRCHPAVFHRALYPAARAIVEKHTRMPLPAYLRRQRNEYPQTFCEFVTLGNVAMYWFPEHYWLMEQTSDEVTPPNHVRQMWSHRTPTVEDLQFFQRLNLTL